MTPDFDRFSDDYDPEPDYDRPTRAEAEADMADDPPVTGRWSVRDPRCQQMVSDLFPQEDEHRFCPVCGADMIGNDPHAPDCPVDTDGGNDDESDFTSQVGVELPDKADQERA